MKITILTGPFCALPPYSIGAIEKLMTLVGEELGKMGANVTFVSKRPHADTADTKRHVYVKGYERTGSSVKDMLLDLIYSWRALKAAPPCDVIALNSIWSPLLYPFFRRKIKKAVYQVHRYPKHQMGCYRAMDALMCVSTHIAQAVKAQSPSVASKVVGVNNPIDTNLFDCREGVHAYNKCMTVVYAGRVHREKGIHLLVEAVDLLRKSHDIGLRIIGATEVERGGGGTAYAEELDTLAKGWSIEWMGAICDPAELAMRIGECHIFCYPSLAAKGEAMPCAPLEGMGVGLPAVVSDMGCFADYIEDGYNGMCFKQDKPDAAQRLADCIERLIADETLYLQMSRNAYATSRKFNAADMAANYYNYFEKIVNGKRLS